MPRQGSRQRRWMAMGLAVSVSGCSLVNGPRQVVQVRSTPPGAAVTLDGDPAGVTPVDVRVLRHNASPVLRIEKDGFDPVDYEIDRGFSSAFVGDLILAAFFGYANVFGEGTSGASGSRIAGMGALGVALVLGPVFGMGSPFAFPEGVDVSLEPLAGASDPAFCHRRVGAVLALDPEADPAYLRARLAAGGRGTDVARLRERLRALRVSTTGGRASEIDPSREARQ